MQDGLATAQGVGEFRTFTFDEMQAQTHGVGHSEDVGKQDRGIEIKACQGLQGDFAGQLRRFGQRQETAGTLARGAVFGQVATGLAHDPDRRGVHGLAPQRAQEAVFGHNRLQGFNGRFLFAAGRSCAANRK